MIGLTQLSTTLTGINMPDDNNFDVYKNLPELEKPPKESVKVLFPNGAYVYFTKGRTKPNLVRYANGDTISLWEHRTPVVSVVRYYFEEQPTQDLQTYLSLEQCKVGHVYRVRSRNLRLAVYCDEWEWEGAEPGNHDDPRFVGIRRKFGSEFLDSEYHWDHGQFREGKATGAFATCKPLEDLGPVGQRLSEGNESLFDELKRLENELL